MNSSVGDCFMRSFARTPKLAADELKDAMKLHVVGVVFHGKPDTPHLFPAAPHLAGNTNLNCESFVRAVRKQFGQTGMLPVLHVQVRVHPLLSSLTSCSIDYTKCFPSNNN
eukprot:1167712-Pleurochrysis_carterae.AAC.1